MQNEREKTRNPCWCFAFRLFYEIEAMRKYTLRAKAKYSLEYIFETIFCGFDIGEAVKTGSISGFQAN